MRARDGLTLFVAGASLVLVLLLPKVEAALVSDKEGCPGSGDLPTRDNLPATRAAVLCLLNAERTSHGLVPLLRSGPLEVASQAHSDDMARRDFYAHETPDGVDPSDRAAGAGYPAAGTTVGENIHWGVEADATPVRIVADWMHSPGHRANILRPAFTEVGVGVAHEAPEPGVRGRAGVYTTDFGGPVALTQPVP